MNLIQLVSIAVIVGLAVLPTLISSYIEGLEAAASEAAFENDYN